MSQDLISNFESEPYFDDGVLFYTATFTETSYAVPVTIPAGVYSIKSNMPVLGLIPNNSPAPLSVGANTVVANYAVLPFDEPNMTLYKAAQNITFTTINPSTTTSTLQNPSNLIYDGTNFLFMASFGTSAFLLMYSSDFVTWSTRDFGITTTVPNRTTAISFAYNSSKTNKYIVVNGTTSSIYYSTDSVTWTSASITGGGNFRFPVINPNVTESYVVISSSVAGYVATSTDAVTWTSRTTGINVGGQCLATNFGSTGIVYILTHNLHTNSNITTSTDGITWTSRESGVFADARAINYINNLWILTYNRAEIYSTSTDGITWTTNLWDTSVAKTAATNLSWVTDNVLYIGTDSDSTKYTTNGTTWTLLRWLSAPPAVKVNNVYYSNTNSSLVKTIDTPSTIAFYKII